MNMFNILEAICDNIASKFPKQNIYINQVPEGFKRPSFYVSMIGFTDKDLSLEVLKRHTAFQVVYFAPIDKRACVDTSMQYAAYITLSQIFQHHGLQVLDRNIKIDSVDGGPRDKEVYLTINFEYAYSPEDTIDPDELYELMKELQIKYVY